jgi:hypothetical protein
MINDLSTKLFQFHNGEMAPLPLAGIPKWLQAALAISPDEYDAKDVNLLDHFLSDHGCHISETYDGGGELLDVWQLPDGARLVQLSEDLAGADVISIYVRDAADWLTCNAQYVAPLAMKIMAEPHHFVWCQDRQKHAA